MTKTDLVYLEHILSAINKIERFVKYRRKKSIDQEMIESAIIRELQIMTESTQRLSKSLKLTAAEIPWHSLAGFRNVLVHDYLGIEPDEIYSIIKSDLPKLKKRVIKMIKFLQEKEKNS
ncbi:MAG: HepT-like ribonuclease domain-containing protein [Rickettsiales bacterium]|nr:HepT-like ribonuclease domain-containing protein [Rickettsiales bacterium]